MQLISLICSVILGVFGFLFAYRLIFIFLGLFRTKRFEGAKSLHRYAVIVSARNEERVIGQLLDSIAMQEYPAELIHVFVVADNCSDHTAAVARAHGATVYERADPDHQTKGYALQFLFRQIERDYGIESFEGYFLFDADNLLKRDYIARMNDAFDSGERIVTSYRNTKNVDSNFISASYAFHWLRTTRFEFRARSALGLSAWIQGCGFLFDSALVKNGWPYTGLTEDRAFSVDAISSGVRISYQHEAQFYDEQPTNMRIALRQRIRWAKGHLEAFRDYGLPLLKGIFCAKNLAARISCYDLLVMTFPYTVAVFPVQLTEIVISILLHLNGMQEEGAVLTALALTATVLAKLIGSHLGVIPMAVAMMFTERGRLPKLPFFRAAGYILLYPLFSIIGYISTWIALFTKVTWKPIPHEVSMEIADVEKSLGEKDPVS